MSDGGGISPTTSFLGVNPTKKKKTRPTVGFPKKGRRERGKKLSFSFHIFSPPPARPCFTREAKASESKKEEEKEESAIGICHHCNSAPHALSFPDFPPLCPFLAAWNFLFSYVRTGKRSECALHKQNRPRIMNKEEEEGL